MLGTLILLVTHHNSKNSKNKGLERLKSDQNLERNKNRTLMPSGGLASNFAMTSPLRPLLS